jgi:hypothetical protein
MNPLTEIYLLLRDVFDPLLEKFAGFEQMEYLFWRYGWDISLDDPTFGKVNQALGFVAPLKQFLQIAETVESSLEQGTDTTSSLANDAALFQSAAAVIDAITHFKLSDLTGLTGPLGTELFWEEIGEYLLDDLLEEYLRIYRANIYLVLHFWGIIHYDITAPDGASRIQHVKTVFDWQQFAALLRDPVTALQHYYKWGDATTPFGYQLLLDSLGRVLRAVHLSTSNFAPGLDNSISFASGSGHQIRNNLDALKVLFIDGFLPSDKISYTVGMQLFAAAKTGETVPSGLVLGPILRGGASGTTSLGSDFSLQWKVAGSADDVIGLVVFPDKIDLVQGTVALGASLQVSGTGTSPLYLLGNARSARIEVYSPSLSISIEGDVDDPDAKFHLSAGSSGQAGCKFVMPLDQADSFVQSNVGNKGLEVGFSAEVIWSSKSGFTFNGAANINVTIPLNLSLGPLQVQRLFLGLIPTDDQDKAVINGEGSVGLSITIGPIAAAIDRLGVELAMDFSSSEKNFGFVDVSLGLKPPSGVGLAIDSAGVSGGGFLSHDDAKHEYSGVLQLQFNDVALQAFGLITTQVAGGSGYSLLALVDANFPPVQLGWGFTLNGVGGLLAVHRSADTDKLRAALKADKLSSVLFPKSAISNAALVLAQLDALFPTAAGRFLFGPMALIGWGTPTILTIALAVILEEPEPVRIILLARLAALLPSASAPLVKINMDALGVLDLSQSQLALDATLYDSKIMGFALSGDMALRANWGTQREFLLAIGGFHPQFTPPVGFPTLQRVTIDMPSGSISKLRLAAYLAITSNTVQFGANLDVFIGVSGFGLSGHLGFDAMLQIDPFHFSADISGSVSLIADGDDLMSVGLDASLDGPAPWHIKGSFKIHFFFFDLHKSFSATWGQSSPALSIPPVQILPLLETAFADVRNWGASLPANAPALVSLRAQNGAKVVAHPLALLNVHQRLVPLDLQITRFGSAAISGATQFTITDFRIGSASVGKTNLQDDFAPAQFLDLTDADKLAGPSFERQDAGVSLGTIAARGSSPARVKQIAYETFYVDDPGGQIRRDSGQKQTLVFTSVVMNLGLGAAGRAAVWKAGNRRFAAPGKPVEVASQSFTITSKLTLQSAGISPAAGTTYSAARTLLAKAAPAQSSTRAQLQIVGTHEMGAS